jgi:tripartite-type tricarboxylate transporter receptor subunit TctC
VAQIVESANYLIVPADSPYKTLQDFVDDVLANPGMVTVANAGVGGGNHIAALLFEEAIGGEFAHITYDGGASAVTGVLANEVNAAVCNTPEGMSNVAAGQIRILASFASKPFADYPDVPLAKDSGVKGTENLVIEQWRSIAVPADTPDEIVAQMSEVAKKVVEDPDFIEKCNTLSIVARYRNVEEVNEFVQSENTRFENLIKTKGFGDRYGAK